MNGTLFTLFLLTATVLGFSQSEKVSLLEENQGKRTHLFVQNHTADTLNVFLRVAAEGFRRSADKPILKDLLPQLVMYFIQSHHGVLNPLRFFKSQSLPRKNQ